MAGIHRTLAARERIESCSVAIVVAGMDGVLPSVIAGLVSTPVIAVPTSVGYGASFGGIAALLCHAEQLCERSDGGQYRQRIRSRLRGLIDQPGESRSFRSSKAACIALQIRFGRDSFLFLSWRAA